MAETGNHTRQAFVNYELLNDAHDEVTKGLDKMQDYANAFQALGDIFKRDSDVGVVFSANGANGLSFICEKLSESMWEDIADLPLRMKDIRSAITFDHESKAKDCA